MLLDDVWAAFERLLFSVPSTDGLFNPYHDRHDTFDLPDAVAVRRQNLRNYLACYPRRPRLFLLAEAPGPWGCRFSGVPLVSEAQLLDETFPISGRPTSQQEMPHREYSAGIYWRVLQPYFPHFFTWNSVPFHPYRPGRPLSIRTPTQREVAAYTGLLAELLEAIRPQHVVAVGRKAERALRLAGSEGIYVRHPSQGGARRFEAGIREVLEEAGLINAS